MAQEGCKIEAKDNKAFLEDETREYFEAHPEMAERLRRMEKVYKTFGEYLNLTQSRIVSYEGGGSNTEVDPNAALSRTNT
jgi:hypothetical protein